MLARWLFLSSILIGIPGPACAGGPLQILQQEFKPLVQTTLGRIDSCGVHFSAATQGEGRLFSVQGSINVLFKDMRLPTVLVKISVVEVRNGQLSRQRLIHAHLRHQNLSTAEFWGANGDDGFSWLMAVRDEQAAVDAIKLAHKIFEGPWLSFNIGDGGSDYTFQLLVAEQDNATITEFFECQSQGLKQLKL